ncbi:MULTISPECIES: hypothetical protein [unclassified Streptomyces]|uniref:hypothetical protein n=1 Tax=unclassified Streptomyces TaxID=2593676 RepID=UPI002DDBE444|nr:hypothetical protein [Streptomyces sp. NBC_01768]WSC32350.1 hypothetical protein OG902_39830 [Streptomyces sp. NBC_01768]WSX06398.1 hypothetical protein OG355_41480 [Streptomyces sp. NBC_00987]
MSHYLPERLNLDDTRKALSADLDGRYGGNCEGRWVGESYWGAQKRQLPGVPSRLRRVVEDLMTTRE